MEVVCLRDHLKEMSCSGCVITSHSSSSQNRMNGKLIIHSPNLRERERTGGGGLITPNNTSITEGKGQFFAKQTKTDGRREIADDGPTSCRFFSSRNGSRSTVVNTKSHEIVELWTDDYFFNGF